MMCRVGVCGVGGLWAWAVVMLLMVVMMPHAHTQERHIRYVRADELRDYNGRCYDAERCSLHTTGETWTVDSTCEQATCVQASNGTLLEKRIRCSELLPLFNENCYIVRVEGKAYPHCCPQLYCEGKLVSSSPPF
ncbi:U-scoloptoxin(16)-Er9a-like [Eriocheir sinensis]|uniref:U-scoloptoxin(16)-Er9a-like n=1 Tax=Eriocheir sinensis TaxID=95602 RepID=UPI0021C61366|nr:U-scoloptoxin(16)-Er9a-like [Eriocheir sinensis]